MIRKCLPGIVQSFIGRMDNRRYFSSTFMEVVRYLSKNKIPSSTSSFSQTTQAKRSMGRGVIAGGDITEQTRIPREVQEYPPDARKIKRNISETIDELLDAQNIWDADTDLTKASLQDESLSPAQRFYLENRELLIRRAGDYSAAKAFIEWEHIASDVDDDWRFYRDPVVRPERGKLWPISADQEGEDDSKSSDGFSESKSFPSIEELVNLLRSQHVEDICPIDLELAGRRDIGEYALIGTVRSQAHGDRVARVARKAVQSLNLENIAVFSNAATGQDWVVVRLGPVVVHLMTTLDRERYRLEQLYSQVPKDAGGDILQPENDLISTDEAKSRLIVNN